MVRYLEGGSLGALGHLGHERRGAGEEGKGDKDLRHGAAKHGVSKKTL